MMSIAEHVARARDALLAGGIPSDEAAGDAEVLARHILGWDLTRFVASRREPAPGDFIARYDAALARRLRREPVSQIVGHREFWGLDFDVSRDVLTPRPETEFVVQAALDACPRSGDPIIVDIGTGSGCIAIALATELPHARLIASDVSLPALTVARRNAARHGVSARIAFLHSSRIPPESDFTIAVSNPPYIPVSQRESLAPEVRDYEPESALFGGGSDGLDFYRQLLTDVPQHLERGGWLIVEVGYDQAAGVAALADPRFWESPRTYRDLQGIDRVLAFRGIRRQDT
jgi:release factor glutamine methyltransferase